MHSSIEATPSPGSSPGFLSSPPSLHNFDVDLVLLVLSVLLIASRLRWRRLPLAVDRGKKRPGHPN